MSGYLGYDPDRLPSLLSAMSSAESELNGLRCDDPEARAAMRRVDGVARTLREQWMPVVRGLLDCSAMTGFQPASIDGGDLVNSYIASLIAGNLWRTSTDPLAPFPHPMDPARAAALAAWLNRQADGLDASLDDDELVELARMVAEILASPTAADAFTTALSPAGLTGVVGAVGRRRTDIELHAVHGGLADGEAGVLATIEQLLTGLGSIVARSSAGRDVRAADAADRLVAAIPLMHPRAAATLIASLDLDADTFARVAAALITREFHHDATSPAYTNGIRAIDSLLELAAVTTNGASRLLVAMVGAPELLLTAVDPNLTNTVLRTGTTPDVLIGNERELVVPGLLLAIDGALGDPVAPYDDRNLDIAAVTAQIAAPYLVELFLASDDSFRYASGDRDEIWDFFVNTPRILDALMTERDLLSSRFDQPLTGNLDHDGAVLFELAQLTGLLDRLYSVAEIDPAVANQANWNLGWTVAARIGRAATPSPYGLVTGAGIAGSKLLFERLGLGPDDVDRLRATVSGDISDRSTLIAALVVDATFAALVERGEIDSGSVPPPAPDLDADDLAQSYVVALERWATDTASTTTSSARCCSPAAHCSTPGRPRSTRPATSAGNSAGCSAVRFRGHPNTPAGASPSTSSRPTSHARRSAGLSCNTAAGKAVRPIGRRLDQSAVSRRVSIPTKSAGISTKVYACPAMSPRST